MLRIRNVNLLARKLGRTRDELLSVVESAPRYFEDRILINPAEPDRRREVLNVTGPLRVIQRCLYKSLLAPRHRPSHYSHGGVRGRHIKSNVEAHSGSTFALTMDIASFYPSISHQRVYKLFRDSFGCSPDVSRVCTRLCTHRGHLALGLITSPLLADCLLREVDKRVGGMCEGQGLIYTRYVDDITISGSYPLEKGGRHSRLISEILGADGFKAKAKKEVAGRLSDGLAITKLRLQNGRLDVRPEYIQLVQSQIEDARRLERGEDPKSYYYNQNQIFGRISFIGWINRGHVPKLLKQLQAINWRAVEIAALARGLVVTRKYTLKKPAVNKL